MIVMSVIPFGLVGAVAGHLLLRMEFSIMTMCGCIALAGMMVNETSETAVKAFLPVPY